MTTFYNKRAHVYQINQNCNNSSVYFREQYQRSQDYYVNLASNNIAQICHKNKEKDNIVVLSQFNYDYLKAQDRQSSC